MNQIKENRLRPLWIGELVAQTPVLQGGMGIGISLGNLAGAVAREKGIGVISAAQIGFKEPDFDRDPRGANLRAIRKEYDRARRIAPDGIIGFNIMTAMKYYADYVKAAIQAGADLIISGAGLPMELPKLAEGMKVKLAPIVSTVKSARILLKYWDKKYRKVPDLLIVEGPKAGGHLGFSEDQLNLYEYCETPASYDDEFLAIKEEVSRYEEAYDRKIPLALAGGISSAKEAAHAFSLGADAIQVATRFAATEECDADPAFKMAYVNAGKEDIVITKSPVGMPGRALKTPFLNRVLAGERIPCRRCHQCLEKCDPGKIPYCITDALIHAARGEVDEALIFCGAQVGRIKRIETVKEVIDSLLPEA